MACPTNKIDSNIVGLRIAEEECYRELPENPSDIVFWPLEPDNFPDFGSETVTEARNPINPSRQNQKGQVVDLNASAGLTQDLTMALPRLWQGFVFADAREKATTAPLNGTPIAITGVVNITSDFQASSGLDSFKEGDIVLATGFNDPANNGLHVVSTATATALTVGSTLVDETPSADAKLVNVGTEFASDDAVIDVSGTLPQLTSTVLDFTTLGLIPGEWIYIGGDTSSSRFSELNNRGWCRINAIGTNYLEFDKTDATFADDAGAGVALRIFYGKVIKNEDDPALIKTRSYTFERTLGYGPNGDPQGEYVHGCVANTMTLNFATATKATVDMGYVGADSSYYKNNSERINGTRPEPVSHHTYNSANNFARIRMNVIDPVTSNPVPAVNYMSDLSLTINNGVTANKALGKLGAFGVSVANFTVSGSVQAYFTDVATVQSVRNNADVTLDMAIAAQNKGFVFDVPLLSLGNGRVNVEKDNPIMLPLDTNAARGKFNNTLTICVFDYLPSIAN